MPNDIPRHTPSTARDLSMKVLLVAACIATLSAESSAQLPSASAASLGMGDNYTAVARGFAAVAWNPANLGLANNPDFSLTFLGARGTGDLGPVTMKDVSAYSGQLLPDAVRDDWMRRVEAGKGESGTIGAGLTYIALSSGNVAFQAATSVIGDANLAPGAIELALYGNAGRTGTARDVSLEGSRVTSAVTSTFAMAFARPIRTDLGTVSLGMTTKYIIGHALLHGEDRGSVLGAQPTTVDVRFPVVVSDTSGGSGVGNHGHGIGIDVGAAYQGGALTASVAVQNIFNSFRWDAASMYYYPLQAFFDADTSYNVTSAQSLGSAPADVQAWVTALRFRPTLSIGAALRASDRLTLTADMRQQLGDGLSVEARTHLGAGAQLRLLPFIPLRAGVAYITDGYLVSAGTGIELGAVNISASVQDRHTPRGRSPGAAIGISFGTR
jgi:hypothetical protein